VPVVLDCWVLISRQGAETPAAGILEYGPPGYPSVGSPQAPLVPRWLRHQWARCALIEVQKNTGLLKPVFFFKKNTGNQNQAQQRLLSTKDQLGTSQEQQKKVNAEFKKAQRKF
jgi:hypothetical protein